MDFPLAIPSANRSSGISPVCANDVFEEFNTKIKMIIDGGKSKIGLESTVVNLSGKIKILRPGIISAKDISKELKKNITLIKKNKLIKSPGALKKHYSPGIAIACSLEYTNFRLNNYWEKKSPNLLKWLDNFRQKDFERGGV